MVTQNPGQQIGNIVEKLGAFQFELDADNQIVQTGGISAIQAINEANLLPETIGIASPNESLRSIKSIFDEGLRDYVDSLPFAERDAFMQGFSGEKFIHPELDARAGNSGGLFGIVSDIGGEGLGILADGLELLDTFSRYTEQSIGFTASYLTEGFGSDLSLGERWDAGKLTYEAFGSAFGVGGNKAYYQALAMAKNPELADQAFDEFVKDNEGGWVDLGMRILLDPLWAIGGMPVVPGLMKMTRIKSLDPLADFIRVGIRPEGVPLLGRMIRFANRTEGPAGTALRTALVRPLQLMGAPIESRLAGRTAREFEIAESLKKTLIDEDSIQRALGQVSDRGALTTLKSQQATRAASNVEDAIWSRLSHQVRRAENPQQMLESIHRLQRGEDLIVGATRERVLENLGVMRQIDFDSFTSLKGQAGSDWRVKFLQELNSGPGRSKVDPTGSLGKIAREFFQVPETPAYQRMLTGWKRVLGITLLNNPGYVVLNAVNNTFTTMFDALDSFDNVPTETLGVFGSKFGLFSGRHNTHMARKFGDNWREIVERQARGSSDWMRAEHGLADVNKHLWDNIGINFGVRAASRLDLAARRTAAEIGLLRADHYLNRWGAVFPDIPDRFSGLVGDTINPTELLDARAAIESGEAFGWLSVRKIENELFEGIADPNARRAAQETLNVHLVGQKTELEDGVIAALKAGDLPAATKLLDDSAAEMKMWQQRANRISNVGPNSPGVVMQSTSDLRVQDWAQLSDEFTYWSTQQELILKASNTLPPMQRGQQMKRLTDNFNQYIEARQQLLGEFGDVIGNVPASKLSVDSLEALTKRYRDEMKTVFDDIVNRMNRVDVRQGRVFHESTQGYLASLGEAEDAFRSALRSTYWPRQLDRGEALEILQGATRARATTVRGLYRDNIARYRVGSFAPPPVLSDAPMMSDRFNAYNQEWQRYTAHMKDNLGRMSSEAENLRSSYDAESLLTFIDDGIAPRMVDYDFARERFSGHMADFSMLDYTHQMGFEQYIQAVFPYEFWPTRTAWHWAQRMAAKPGAPTAVYKLWEFQQDWQQEVNDRYLKEIEDRLAQENLPDEVRIQLQAELENAQVLTGRMRKLIIPVPGLNGIMEQMDKLAGPLGFSLKGNFNNEIAFDPIAAMFPIANWSIDYRDFDAEPTNWFGRLYRDLENNPFASVNPALKSTLALTGVLPERNEAFEWLRRTGSPALVPFGVGPAGQAVHRWWSRGDEGPIAKLEDALGIDIREFYFENGYGPQGVLNYLAAEITGTDPSDVKNFELYGASRTLAAMAAEDTRLVMLEQERQRRKDRGENAAAVDKDINLRREQVAAEYVEAYYNQDGPVWDKAFREHSSQQGLKDLTSWLFGMGGINVWKPGEPIQQGLEFLFDATMKVGNADQRRDFFERFPEFTPRRIQDTVLTSQDEAMKIARESLFFFEADMINKKYEERIGRLTEQRDAINEQVDKLETTDLSLRVNREARGALFGELDKINDQLAGIYDERDVDFDRLDALYGQPENSTNKNPWERALDNLQTEWFRTFRIKDDDARRAAQEAFLERFPASDVTNQGLDWLFLGSEANVLREKAGLGSFGLSNEQRREINEKLDTDIEALTLTAHARITQKDILDHIGRTEQGPITPQLAEYRMAQSLMTQYRAIDELGLPDDERRKRKEDFWDANPLLERYFGIASYHGHPDEAIQMQLQRWYEIWEQAPEAGDARRSYIDQHRKEIDQLEAILEDGGLINKTPEEKRLAEIWDGYYALPEGSARRNYISGFREEIDRLNSALRRKPSQSQLDVAREGQIWSHYYSLPKGDARRAYLGIVRDELNAIRRRLGKDPIGGTPVNENPRLSDSAPVEEVDISKLVPVQ